MSMLKNGKLKYNDGRTKQSFKDQTDIHKILAKAQRTGTVSHINTYGEQYGEFADFDFLQAQLQIAKGREIFEALPSEVRTEFANEPANFFAFANDEKNTEKLSNLLPQIAEPGAFFPVVQGNTETEVVATETTESTVETTTEASETDST